MSPASRMHGWQRRLLALIVRGVPARFYGNLSWQYASSIFGMGMTFIQTLLIGRALGPRELGILSVGLGVSAIVFQAMELRLHEAVIKYVSEFWEAGDGARTLAAVKLSLLADAATGTLALLGVSMLAGLAGTSLLDDERASTVIILSALGIFFMNVSTATATGILRVFSEFKTQAIVTIGGAAFKLVATIIALWYFGVGLLGILLITVIGNLLTNAVLLAAALRHLHRRVPLLATRAPISLLQPRKKEIATFVSHTYALSWTMIPTKDLDITLLAYFVELPAVGIYRIAKTFMAAMWTIADPAFMVIYPELARMYAARRFAEMQQFVRKLTGLLGIFGIALYAGAVLIVPVAIRYTVGPAYSEASTLFALMAWGVMIWAPLVWVNPLMFAAGRTSLLLKASTVGAILIALLHVICIARWGVYGAAAVFAASTPIVMSLVIFLGWRAGLLPPSRLAGESAVGRR